MDFEKIKEDQAMSNPQNSSDMSNPAESDAGNPPTPPAMEGSTNLGGGNGSGQLVSVGDMFSGGINLLKSNLKTLVILTLVPLLAYFVAAAVGMLLALVTGAGLGVLGGNARGLGLGLGIVFGLLAIGWALVQMYITFASQAGMIYALKNSDLSVKEAFNLGRTKVVPFFVLMFLLSGIVLGGFVLFIIPGLILATLFGFSLYVLIDEDYKDFKALVRSKQYVKPHFWGVVGRIIVFWLFSLLLVFAISMVTAGVDMVLSSVIGNKVTIITDLISMALNLLMTPFSFAVMWVLYSSVKSLSGDLVEPEISTGSKFGYIVLMVLGVVLPLLFTVGGIIALATLGQNPKSMQQPFNYNMDQSFNWTTDYMDEMMEDESMPMEKDMEENMETMMNDPQDMQDLVKKAAEAYGMNTKDVERSLAMSTYIQSLEAYKGTNGVYPESLTQLSNDPNVTREDFSYLQLEDGEDYKLCVSFDSTGEQCLLGSQVATEENLY